MLLHAPPPWVRLPTRVLARVALPVPPTVAIPRYEAPPIPVAPQPAGRASAFSHASAQLANILGTEQRRALCLTLATKRIERRTQGDDAFERFFKTLFRSAEDEAQRIERNEDAAVVVREGLTLHDLLACEISIAQIYQYWAPDLAGLRRLVPRYQDLVSHRHLLNIILLTQLYDPAELLVLFEIDATSLPRCPLPGPELVALGFSFTEETFFRTMQALRASGLSPEDCADLGVTLPMLARLGITVDVTNEGYRANRLSATWSPGALQRAFYAPSK